MKRSRCYAELGIVSIKEAPLTCEQNLLNTVLNTRTRKDEKKSLGIHANKKNKIICEEEKRDVREHENNGIRKLSLTFCLIMQRVISLVKTILEHKHTYTSL